MTKLLLPLPSTSIHSRLLPAPHPLQPHERIHFFSPRRCSLHHEQCHVFPRWQEAAAYVSCDLYFLQLGNRVFPPCTRPLFHAMFSLFSGDLVLDWSWYRRWGRAFQTMSLSLNMQLRLSINMQFAQAQIAVAAYRWRTSTLVTGIRIKHLFRIVEKIHLIWGQTIH